MSRRNRLPKPVSRLIQELEGHLSILRDNYRRMRADRALVGLVAATLRVLVCRSSGTEGLLWRLAERLTVSDEVLLHTHGGVNPDLPLAKGLRLCVVPIQRPGSMADPKFTEKFPVQQESLRDVIKTCEAVFTLGKSLTHEAIIKKIAEQIGTAHSDDGIEPGLATIEEVLFFGRPMYVDILELLSELAMEVGERVIACAVSVGDYRRERFSPLMTISGHVCLREIPLGRVGVLSMRSHTAALLVEAFLHPQTFAFKVTKDGQNSTELSVPLPQDWAPGDDVAFCLSYDQKVRRLWTLGPHVTGDVSDDCDLGFVDGLSPSGQPDGVSGSEPYILTKHLTVHTREFSPEQVAQLPQMFKKK